MDDVLAWKFADWIGSWANEDELNHQMGIAFVGDMHKEIHEDGQPFDAFWDFDDRAQVNPAEELISEETIIDEVEIPGPPQDETGKKLPCSQGEDRCQATSQPVWPCTEAGNDPSASRCEGSF